MVTGGSCPYLRCHLVAFDQSSRQRCTSRLEPSPQLRDSLAAVGFGRIDIGIQGCPRYTRFATLPGFVGPNLTSFITPRCFLCPYVFLAPRGSESHSASRERGQSRLSGPRHARFCLSSKRYKRKSNPPSSSSFFFPPLLSSFFTIALCQRHLLIYRRCC